MDLKDIAEYSIFLSATGLSRKRPLAVSDAVTVEFWKTIRVLERLWHRALLTPPAARRSGTTQLQEEILVVRLLVRIASAVMACPTTGGPRTGSAAVERNLRLRPWHRHLEATRSFLMLANQETVQLSESLSISRLNRRLDRWADLLLSRAASLADNRQVLLEFAADSARCRQFAEDHELWSGPGAQPAVVLQTVGLRQAIPRRRVIDPARAEACVQLQQFCLSLVDEDAFHATGELKLSRRVPPVTLN